MTSIDWFIDQLEKHHILFDLRGASVSIQARDRYNQEIESLYTKEQVIEAMIKISSYYNHKIDNQDLDWHKASKKIIESLKKH